MSNWGDLKKLANEVNSAFPEKEDLWSMVCTPTVILDLIADMDKLVDELNRPDEIVADPVSDYAGLRKQFLALRTICNSKARQTEHWRRQSGDDVRKAIVQIADNVNAERDTNAMLTDALEHAEASVGEWQDLAERRAQRMIALEGENETLRKDSERLKAATDFVQKLCDSAGKQTSVATGYLHDILSVLSKELND